MALGRKKGQGRAKTFTVLAFNITAQPHDKPDVYERIFEEIFDLHQVVQIHGDRLGLIESLGGREAQGFDGREVLKGTIVTFIDMDSESPWFDLRTKKKIDKAEAHSRVVIPQELRPNTADFQFSFDIGSHTLAVQAKSVMEGRKKKLVALTPGSVERLFQTLFYQPEIVRHFKSVRIQAIPDSGKVEKILASQSLRFLSLTLYKPNPDVLEDLLGDVFERMEEMNADEIQETVRAKPGESLKPDEELKNLARIAATNGEVRAEERGPRGRMIPVSTASLPAKFDVEYFPTVELESAAMDRAAEKAFSEIQEHRNRYRKRAKRRKRSRK